jgi:hypothetical protein
MPYEVKKVKGGFKVFKKGTKTTYSNKPLTKKRATAQATAIRLSELGIKKKK